MNKKHFKLLVFGLLALMILTSVSLIPEESAIMDEVAHIPAGYSYLAKQDMRLNPEHPPLLKDLSAIPLLFLKNINFPSQLKSWQDEVNSQWNFGFNFLYQSGNDADQIIFWARLPMLLILLLLGLYLWRWTKDLFGEKAGLLALFLYSFAPTFIAHGHYVTTDVGAATAFFIASYYFVRWLKEGKNWENLIKAGIAFGLAELAKFSLILLLPYFGLLIIIWLIADQHINNFNKFIKKFGYYLARFVLILIIGSLLIYAVYYFHTIHYPIEKQVSDTNFISSQFPVKVINQPLVWLASHQISRPYAQYLLGLFMVFQRATGGNTTYFLGDVSSQGWHYYFPVIYLIKTPLALQCLTLLVLVFVAWKFFNKKKHIRFRSWLRKHFSEIAALLFLIIYWTASMVSNLNIGVRHILPTLPFVYLLLSGQIIHLSDYLKKKKLFNSFRFLLIVLLAWYALSSLSASPYYLAYFNELVGGPSGGYRYVTDSNLDWGQDLKRLDHWLDQNQIDKIKVDYFGGARVEYYLGDKYEPWHGDYDPAKAKNSWLAISATFLQQGRGRAIKGFQPDTNFYRWLNQYQPVTVIGHSIFVYHIE